MDIFGDHLFKAFQEKGKKQSNFLKDDTFNFDKNAPELPALKESAPVVAPPAATTTVIKDSLLLKAAQEDDDMYLNIPKISIHRINTAESCLHEVAVPPGTEYVPLRTYDGSVPARTYSFDLDPFQKEAILCVKNNQSVLVSAHTSAGKTVVAEYAIAMALAEKQRVIYTTPIKALSNQKYRELMEVFGDVGLMTGDVTINPEASCLIMTTEILRSMLYRGNEITREVAWVIFDEIHYMRDKERGVIWEETIILLNDSVHYVFLSATIPNARQFAEWIAYLHKQPCHVVYTEQRPVPLHHYVFPAGGDGLHLVVDENGLFREDNFGKAMTILREGVDSGRGQTSCAKILRLIHDRHLTPCIIFNFSRRECEAYASEISAKLDFNEESEKKLVDKIFENATGVLSCEDQGLPQVQSLLPLLRRGIGIHHSGILPILKETIEILFAEGLIKALFATETFAMGLNMPARTVLFTAARKFDGKSIRWMNSGEYIQMSGRAGRRGIDDRGISILVIDERMSPLTAKQIIKGQPMPLNSAFKLTYNMVLNLLRVEGINPEFMLERSFHQFQNYAQVPQLQRDLEERTKEFTAFQVPMEEEMASYYKLRSQLKSLGKQLSAFMREPKYILRYLLPGRLVKIESDDHDFDWCVVVSYTAKLRDQDTVYVLDVLASITPESAKQSFTSMIRPCPLDKGELQVIPVELEMLRHVSAIRINVPTDIRSTESLAAVMKTLREVRRRFEREGLPLLDPIEDMRIENPEMKEVIAKIEAFEDRVFAHSLNEKLSRPEIDKLYIQYEKKVSLEDEMKEARQRLKDARSLLMIEELRKRKRVLRRLGYCDQSDAVLLKGRVACEIDTSEELVLTELLFEGVFNEMNACQIASLLSCFVFQERHNELPRLSGDLAAALRAMQDVARRVAKVTNECKLDVNEDAFVDSFKPFLMDVVYAWAEGKAFAGVVKMTTIFEGSIIRCIRRLEELLRQMASAAKSIENNELEAGFLEAATSIKRDIIFAASLYL